MSVDIIKIKEKAEKGDRRAQIFMAHCYSAGRFGVARNYDESDRWYKIVADQYKEEADEGDVSALKLLAECYSYGTGVNFDPMEGERLSRLAFEKYKIAAEAGDTDAQYELSEFYIYGYTWASDKEERERLLRLASESGHAKAQLELARSLCYDRYPDGSVYLNDNDEAREWFLLAASNLRRDAENGDGEAQYYLAVCYKEGYGVVCDFSEAVKWCKSSAWSGYLWAYDLLEDLERIAEYERGVRAGDPEACYQLARCYYYGITVVRDYEEARALYEKAASMGHEDSEEMLKKVNKSFLVYRGAGALGELGSYLDECAKKEALPDPEIIKTAVSENVKERYDTEILLGIFTRDFKDRPWAAEMLETALLSVKEKDIRVRGEYPTAADEAKKMLFWLYYDGEIKHTNLGVVSFSSLKSISKAAELIDEPYLYDDEYVWSISDADRGDEYTQLLELGYSAHPDCSLVASHLLKEYIDLCISGKDTLGKMLSLIEEASYDRACCMRDVLADEIEKLAKSIEPEETERLLSAINDRCFDLGVRNFDLPKIQLSLYLHGRYDYAFVGSIEFPTLQNIEKALALSEKYGLPILAEEE